MTSKGDGYERDLRDWWYAQGGAAMRTPASGSGTKRSYPDVLGTFDGVIYGIELKYTSGKRGRFSKDEAEKLFEFCELWDARPMFVVRFSQDTSWYVDQYDSYEEIEMMNDNKSFAVDRDERKKYPTLASVISGSAIDW